MLFFKQIQSLHQNHYLSLSLYKSPPILDKLQLITKIGVEKMIIQKRDRGDHIKGSSDRGDEL